MDRVFFMSTGRRGGGPREPDGRRRTGMTGGLPGHAPLDDLVKADRVPDDEPRGDRPGPQLRACGRLAPGSGRGRGRRRGVGPRAPGALPEPGLGVLGGGPGGGRGRRRGLRHGGGGRGGRMSLFPQV